MTAEIAVMNKEAIALAADSAVTMRDEAGEKVFPSANKIFALSKYEPVAAMVYGGAVLMGVPWEPAVKLFRRELGRTAYPTVQKYADELLRFLGGHSRSFPVIPGDRYYREHVAPILALIRSSAESAA